MSSILALGLLLGMKHALEADHVDKVHFHAHSHAGEGAHEQSNHHHSHLKQPNMVWRVLVVGLVHGLAGSTALVVLAVSATQSLWQGVAYTVLFGFGSMVGMALLSVVIALPLRYSARRLTWLHNGLLGIVGLCTVFIGAALFITNGVEIT